MANRLYYALFADAHARLLRAGVQPRADLKTWQHASLPSLVRQHLVASMGRPAAARYSQSLQRTRILREIADYRPEWTVDRAALKAALSDVSACLEIRR